MLAPFLVLLLCFLCFPLFALFTNTHSGRNPQKITKPRKTQKQLASPIPLRVCYSPVSLAPSVTPPASPSPPGTPTVPSQSLPSQPPLDVLATPVSNSTPPSLGLPLPVASPAEIQAVMYVFVPGCRSIPFDISLISCATLILQQRVPTSIRASINPSELEAQEG
jgi:hypothetical protein